MSDPSGLIGRILDKTRDVLQGEPLRAITYGAAVVIYFVARGFGAIPDQTFDEAIVQATAAAAIIVTVVESARRFVWSPRSVSELASELGEGRG
jgi:hypothetical protein